MKYKAHKISNNLLVNTINPGSSSLDFTLHIMLTTRRNSMSKGSGLKDLALSITSGLVAGGRKGNGLTISKQVNGYIPNLKRIITW
jgi:hypothetical protein